MGTRMLALGAAAMVAAGTPVAAAPPVECSAAGDTRCETWWATWDAGPGDERSDRAARAEDSAVSPDGATVYVTGTATEPGDEGSDAVTLALDAHSGDRLWARQYDAGRADGSDFNAGRALAVSPGGRRVYVAGYRNAGPGAESDWMLLAYRASDGRLRWAGSGKTGSAQAVDVAVSPDGRRVYATGAARQRQDTVTVAFRARTGAVLWRKRYGVDASVVRPAQIEVRGTSLFVLAAAQRADDGRYDTTVVKYDVSGTRPSLEWTAVTHESGGPFVEEQMAVSADGSAVYVAGTETDASGLTRTKTVRLEAGTGRVSWSEPEEGLSAPVVEVDPGGRAVFVAGHTGDGVPAVTSRDTSSGTVQWSVTAEHSAWSELAEAAVDGERDVLVVTGGRLKHPPRPNDGYTQDSSSDVLTLSFDTRTGAERWSARSNYPDTPYEYFAAGRTVSIARGRVFVGGDLMRVVPGEVETEILVGAYAP